MPAPQTHDPRVSYQRDMRILVLDTETSDAPGTCVEVACAIVDTLHRLILWSAATVLRSPKFTTNAAVIINQIPDAAIEAVPVDLAHDTLAIMSTAGSYADVVVAHNARFDNEVLADLACAYEPVDPQVAANIRMLLERPWVCSQESIRFPRQTTSRKLTHLAVDHGVHVVDAHRAAGDVRALAALLLQCEDLDQQIQEARQPRSKYMAFVSYERRDQAKAAGFRWNPELKLWWIELGPSQLARLLADHPHLNVYTLEEHVTTNADGETLTALRRGVRCVSSISST